MNARAARILVYEHVTAGGLQGLAPAAVEAELWPLGTAMREAITADLLALPASVVAQVGVIDAQAPADEPVPGVRLQRIRPRDGEGALDALQRLALRHDRVWAVAPETDGLMQACRTRVGAARWLGSDAQALWLSASKMRTLTRLAEAGAPTPLDPALAQAASHWVVKPDDGAGATDTRRHDHLDAARADAASRRGPVTLQAWIDGEPLSLTMLCHADRIEPLSLNRQRIGIDGAGLLRFDGVSPVARPGDADPRWPALMRLAGQLHAAAPGLRGIAGIDLVWHATRGPVLIELNARTTCAYVGLSTALGRPLAHEVLRLFPHAEPAHA
ncbi:ATP-grasp domain-containing protein [Leptothrix discophora]|uniref:ATP-grasp domain-containing protein n=1 Tax=Leptothrix discophora TaxID=89 RepID=A0ABT9G8W4_LEPDI|nr:ATP-grasp domain-containing protein [Leptothrix discophora]MDP4302747.1 ATP-grasp domain-containing protein [Leptothrix discophora]